jgi:branched-chain amino acid transport system ATP-binding protein
MRNEGIPIVLVEQNVRRALDVVNRFYAIERGQVVLQGQADAPADRQALLGRLAI